MGIELDKYCISWLRDRNEAKRRNCGRVKSEEPDDWPPLLWIYRLYACLTLFMSRDDIASMHNNRVLLAITRVRIASMILVWIRIIGIPTVICILNVHTSYSCQSSENLRRGGSADVKMDVLKNEFIYRRMYFKYISFWLSMCLGTWCTLPFYQGPGHSNF